jgi:hypothetical protein
MAAVAAGAIGVVREARGSRGGAEARRREEEGVHAEARRRGE